MVLGDDSCPHLPRPVGRSRSNHRGVVDAMIYLGIGVGTFAVLGLFWLYVAITRRHVCALMADTLLNGAILFGVISVIILSDLLDLVTAQNRASINILFSLLTCVVQVQIIYVHRQWHRIVGGEP